MKKNILIALLALMAVVLNGNAQNNTYNMVIEMANGTKINIGPNEVKNISFNNGVLVMTGEDMSNFVDQQTKMNNRIDSLAMENLKSQEESRMRMSALEAQVAYISSNPNLPALSEYVKKEELQLLKDEIQMLKNDIANIAKMLKDLENAVEAITEKE